MNTFLRHALPFALALSASCGGDDTNGDTGDDTGEVTGSRAAVLMNLGQNVIAPRHVAANTSLTELASATAAYAESPSDATREAAQDAWRSAMEIVQELEVMQIGPAARMDLSSGGRDLRDELYAWPTLNRCAVDQFTAGDEFDDATSAAGETLPARGLGVIEYLLFDSSSENGCSALAPLNDEGQWAAIEGELEQRRASHASHLAALVAAKQTELTDAWFEGDFQAELTDPTRSGALYGSAQEGLNAISDALFYLDKEAKDMKLGVPAGITGCEDSDTCPDARESRFADASMAHIVANLQGFKAIYTGEDGPGFDTLLEEMGAGEFAASMLAHIDEAIAAATMIDQDLETVLADDPEAVRDVHAKVRVVSEDLKTMFLSVLDLEAPDRAAGDND